MCKVFVVKKDGTLQPYCTEKIVNAVTKSASRAMVTFSDEEMKAITDSVMGYVNEHYGNAQDTIHVPIAFMHNSVESSLERINPAVAKSYRDYRNYKQDFIHLMDDTYRFAQKVMYVGDKENSNADSAMVSTKRSLIFNHFNKELYQKFFMTTEEIQACRDGYIYVHDMSARRDTMNCCLFDISSVLNGGFEMGNIWYNEPKTLDTAFDVIGDIVLSAASQQYGGFTVPNIDRALARYAEKSYQLYFKEALSLGCEEPAAESYAYTKTAKEMEQGFQGWEYKFNTVASSRGDYPFITLTFGNGIGKWEVLASKTCLRVRREGQGKKGYKKPVLFPKLVFLYDEALHGPGGILEEVFEEGILTSSKTMYPDWLSLTGDGYVASIYKQYGVEISPMGCRAFLSPWWERGGLYKADEDDKPVFVGRFNIGVVSLHLPMILAKANKSGKSFYEELDYYLDLIRKLHLRTYDYLGEMRASCNPLAYCEGGFLGGHLQLTDKIAPVLDSATASFGITALNELQMLYNKRSLVEEGRAYLKAMERGEEYSYFAKEVMEYINAKIDEFKREDGRLYAIYGTPAENLCGLQVKQFRAKYGIIKGVSDKTYVSNSFHCHVSEEINPTEKQDLESVFWNYFNGGKIQYVRYPVDYNINAVRSLVRRAMKMGYYEGVNLSLAYCDDCGHKELEMDTCPKCGSRNLTKIDRMNGYLSYSRVHGDSRLSDHKMDEIADRVSM